MDLQKDQRVESSLTQSPTGRTEFIAWGNFTFFDEYDYEIYVSRLRNSNRARTCVGGKNAGTLSILGQILLTMIWQTVFIIKAIIKLYEILAS